MCSIDSGLWCWDGTTQAASDDAPFQRRGWRAVLSFSFKVRVCQGRVTLPCRSLRGVRAPNRNICCFLLPYLSSISPGLSCLIQTPFLLIQIFLTCLLPSHRHRQFAPLLVVQSDLLLETGSLLYPDFQV